MQKHPRSDEATVDRSLAFTRCRRPVITTILQLLCLFFAFASFGQVGSNCSIVGWDVNSRTWQYIQCSTNSTTGEVSTKLQTFQELGNGICYQTAEGQWLDSQDLIELTATGARAIHGPLTAQFSGDIATSGAITVTPRVSNLPGSTPIRWSPIGLFYFDPASNQTIEIASVQSSQGALYPPNVIVYTNLLNGLKADLMLVWTKAGCDESLILKEAPPPPSAYGLSGSARLQYWSAVDCPDPLEDKPVTLASGLTDHILIFGGYWLPAAPVYMVGNTPVPANGQPARLPSPPTPGSVCAAKKLVTIGGEKVLIEEVNFSQLAPLFSKLGQTAIPHKPNRALEGVAPSRMLAGARPSGARPLPVRLTRSAYIPEGLVLDPSTTLSGSASSWTFSANMTYYIPQSFTVGPGTATFQNNSCIKLAQSAYLMLSEASVSFPSSGSKVIFTSKDDNSYGTVITGSTSEPGYAAAQAIWVYNRMTRTTIQNLLIRWAQQGIHYTEETGSNLQPGLNSAAFENCSTGVYLDTGNDTLYLSNDSYCNLPTPVSIGTGYVYGSMTQNCGTPANYTPVDASASLGAQSTEGEPAVSINPANAQNIFMAFNFYTPQPVEVATAFANDGGTTWTTGQFQGSRADPSVCFDRFGNLFCSYLTDPYPSSIPVLLSTTGGGAGSFSTRTTFPAHGPQGLDRPTLTTGPSGSASSVWLSFRDFDTTDIAVSGAAVSSLGSVGAWNSATHIPNSLGYGNADIAVGPTGQVAVVFQSLPDTPAAPTDIRMSVNVNGLSQPTAFPSAWSIATSQIASQEFPPAAPHRGVWVVPGLAWDRTGGQYRNRLYLVYTDKSTGGTYNYDIYVKYSLNNGASGSWSAPVKINTDSTTTSQFFPRIAVDQTSEKVAVCWYDCRADAVNNTKSQFYAAVSCDGGQTFSSSNVNLEHVGSLDWQSDPTATFPFSDDYWDYTGLAYYGGYFYPVWADNSNGAGGNPDGTKEMDIYVARVHY